MIVASFHVFVPPVQLPDEGQAEIVTDILAYQGSVVVPERTSMLFSSTLALVTGSMAAEGGRNGKGNELKQMAINIPTRSRAATIPAYVRYFFFIGAPCKVCCALRQKLLSFIRS
jgi:hypothetical protein